MNSKYQKWNISATIAWIFLKLNPKLKTIYIGRRPQIFKLKISKTTDMIKSSLNLTQVCVPKTRTHISIHRKSRVWLCSAQLVSYMASPKQFFFIDYNVQKYSEETLNILAPLCLTYILQPSDSFLVTPPRGQGEITTGHSILSEDGLNYQSSARME